MMHSAVHKTLHMHTLFTNWNGLDITQISIALQYAICVELYPERGNHSIIALCNDLNISNLQNGSIKIVLEPFHKFKVTAGLQLL